jgi:putative oxidoreductase
VRRSKHPVLDQVGRALLGGIFIRSGWDVVRDPGARPEAAAKIGLPEPELMVRLNAAAMLAGGTALALGILPRAAAAGLVASLVPTTLAGHRFWEEDDPKTAAMQRTHFLKNLAMIGGLILVIARDA